MTFVHFSVVFFDTFQTSAKLHLPYQCRDSLQVNVSNRSTVDALLLNSCRVRAITNKGESVIVLRYHVDQSYRPMARQIGRSTSVVNSTIELYDPE